MEQKCVIRKSLDSELGQVKCIIESAFGSQEGPKVTRLVDDLMKDPTAEPRLSLVAVCGDELVGHILFTNASIVGDASEDESSIQASILAPLAVVPSHQKKGIGGMLINEGVRLLKDFGVSLVFVLGYPEYYPRYKFRCRAAELGFDPSYPIEEKNADAWMIMELKPGTIGRVRGKVKCADAMMRPEYWRE